MTTRPESSCIDPPTGRTTVAHSTYCECRRDCLALSDGNFTPAVLLLLRTSHSSQLLIIMIIMIIA